MEQTAVEAAHIGAGVCTAMVSRLAEMGVLGDNEVDTIPFPDRGDGYPSIDSEPHD